MAVHEWFTDDRIPASQERDADLLGVRVANALAHENAPVRNGDVEESQAWRLDAICFESALARMLAIGR